MQWNQWVTTEIINLKVTNECSKAVPLFVGHSTRTGPLACIIVDSNQWPLVNSGVINKEIQISDGIQVKNWNFQLKNRIGLLHTLLDRSDIKQLSTKGRRNLSFVEDEPRVRKQEETLMFKVWGSHSRVVFLDLVEIFRHFYKICLLRFCFPALLGIYPI
jgi:hypothetical protein